MAPLDIPPGLARTPTDTGETSVKWTTASRNIRETESSKHLASALHHFCGKFFLHVARVKPVLRQMADPSGKIPLTLLVVDDRQEVLHALTRYFKLDFKRVVGAQNVDEAERLLQTEKPTFLLCDYWLGDNCPPSTTFLPRWRKENPCLKRIALMTGTKSSSIPPCAAVDDIFAKPLRLSILVDYFRLHVPAPPTEGNHSAAATPTASNH